MNHPLDDDDLPSRYRERRAEPNRADREIALGTPTILGIFFVLVVAAAAIFGTGYSMGRKSAESAQAATLADSTLTSSSGSPKPAAGSLAAQPVSPPSQPAAPDSSVQTATVALPSPKSAAAPSDRILAGDKPSTVSQPAAPRPQPAISNLQPAATFVVQVAAVSSQEVADILLASLQKKGYTVAVRQESQDKLLHVQIGPFPDRKQADAMRARVLADGFNAIVK